MQILIALILGIVVGLICYFTNTASFTADYLKPIGTIFVNLLKFIVVPVVLFSMIDGILSMGDMRKVGSVGWKTVAYFLCTTAVACVIGLVFANIFNGAGLFPVLQNAEGAAWTGAASAKLMDTLVGIFPSNMWAAFVNANMLQIIVISLFFGGAILAAGEKGQLCKNIVSSFYAVIEQLMMFIISLAPIGVFTMMAWVVATQGPEILGSLGIVLLCAYLAYIVHAVLMYSLSAIYQCVATVFLASCCGISLSISQMALIVVTATLASIGTAGVSGAGMIMLAMVLTAMGIDVDMIMIIYGIDRLFDMGRTCLNITGDIACSLCVTKWESKT